MINPSQPALPAQKCKGWFTSSFSSNANQCVEVRFDADCVSIRDSKYRHNPANDLKVVSIAEKRYVDLASVTPGPEAIELSAKTGKPAEVVQLILDSSTEHFLATERGPIIARHTLGYQLTSAGIDRAGAEGAWLLPVDPDASARSLRDALIT